MMKYYQEEVEVPDAWSSELPTDLLGLIADNLCLSQFIRFGCVCLGWRSFSIQNYQHIKLPSQVPVLIIPIPPSLLSTVHHHQKKIPSPPSSSSSSSDEEDYEEGEQEDLGEEEKVIKEEEVVEEEKVHDDDDDDEDESSESEEEVVVASVALESEESEEEEEVVVVIRKVPPERYYNPKEIWQGQDHKQRHRSARNFYSLSEKMVYHDFPLPVPYYENIRGSSHGWLVTVQECWRGEDNREPYLTVRLYNPFRTDNNEIQLPPFTNGNPGNLAIGERIYNSHYLRKAFLSANPSSLSDPITQLVVLGIYGRYRLAFCRPGDKFWTPLVDIEDYRPVQDLICYNNQFYAILQSGYVFSFVFDAAQPFPTPIVTEAFSPPQEGGYPRKGTPRRYLVESEGDLLQVRRNKGQLSLQESLEEIGLPTPMESGGYITRQFLVFKLDPTGQWVEMKTLNDHMIFIGDNSSVSISASDFPGGWSRPNSIYYTDDNYEAFVVKPHNGPHDFGVFNLEDGSFERHYEAESKTMMPPPIWIQPML